VETVQRGPMGGATLGPVVGLDERLSLGSVMGQWWARFPKLAVASVVDSGEGLAVGLVVGLDEPMIVDSFAGLGEHLPSESLSGWGGELAVH